MQQNQAQEEVAPLGDQLRQQQAHSAQSHFYSSREAAAATTSPSSLSPATEATSAQVQLQNVAQFENFASLSSNGGGSQAMNGHFSPLEILDQAEDDERLLQALEGLTLSTAFEDEQTSSNSGQGDEGKSPSLESCEAARQEPEGEHGTRSQFISDVSERLIARVNTEAADLGQAKQLMVQYMMEFCAEYDRCGYGTKSHQSKNALRGSAAQSENQQTWSDRTSASSANKSAAGIGASDSQTNQKQLAFDNQILKKGVRVLSKNLQRANEMNRVKDQQLKVLRNILMHQKAQMTALQTQQTQLMAQGTTAPAAAISVNIKNGSPVTHVTSQASAASAKEVEQNFIEADSSMMPSTDYFQGSQSPGLNGSNAALVQQNGTSSIDEENASSRAAILNRSLHLQSMNTMQNHFRHNNQNPDIY